MIDTPTHMVDPDLTQRVRTGTYVVDAGRVAEAMLRRCEGREEPPHIAGRTRCSAMLVAGERDRAPVSAEQHDARPGLDRT
jgi:hypothetical protein